MCVFSRQLNSSPTPQITHCAVSLATVGRHGIPRQRKGHVWPRVNKPSARREAECPEAPESLSCMLQSVATLANASQGHARLTIGFAKLENIRDKSANPFASECLKPPPPSSSGCSSRVLPAGLLRPQAPSAALSLSLPCLCSLPVHTYFG